MGRKRFTDVWIKKLRPPQFAQEEYYDTDVVGLRLRVSRGGTKAFTLWYRFGSKACRLALGRYPHLSLVKAREAAREVLQQLAEGKDPRIEKRRFKQDYSTKLFGHVVEDFIESYAKPRTRSWVSTQAYLNREFVTQWKDWPLQEIKRQDVKNVLDAIVRRGSPSTANHAFAVLRKLFNWSVDRGDVIHSPCIGIQTPSKSESRDRVLTNNELSQVWTASKEIGWPYGSIIQLLILTGQRRKEVAGMEWREVELEEAVWTIPGRRTKANRIHRLPLSRQAVELIGRLPKAHDVLVFPAKDRDNPASGFSKWKQQLDGITGVRGWVVHDLRRTVATGLASLQVEPHIVEQVLNHALPGVSGTYNQYRYLGEMRTGLQLWADSQKFS